MIDERLMSAVKTVPTGAWAVGVSGGADSVGLLRLLRFERPDLRLHVVHLDHLTRGADSTGDAEFTRKLAMQWQLPCTVARLDQIEPGMRGLPANKSARFRTVRFELFRQVVREEQLLGIVLAHHADDQAETVLHRLLRGARSPYVNGMFADTQVDGLRVLRPLLGIRARLLRDYLDAVGQDWREDASNASMDYFRNQLRVVLRTNDELVGSLLDLHEAMATVRHWLDRVVPTLTESFRLHDVANYPPMIAAEALRRWLVDRGSPVEELTGEVIGRLLDMVTDAATPPRAEFPGRVRVIRRGGRVLAQRAQ